MLAKLRQRLEGRDFLRNVLTLMSGTAMAQVISLAAAPIIGRIYTAHEMGVYTAFMSLVAGLVTIATWRYDLAIVLPKKAEDARALYHLATRLSLVTCLLASLILTLLAVPISDAMNQPDLRLWLPLVGVTAFAMAQISALNFWCNRNKQYKIMSSNKIGQSGVTAVGQIGLGAARTGAAGMIVSTLLGQAIAALSLVLRTRGELLGQPRGSMRAMMREHRKMPLLNGPTAVLDTIRLNGTQVLIATMFTTAALGHFGQAWRLMQLPAGLINTSLSQVFYQKMAVTPRGQMFRVVREGIVRSVLVGALPFAFLYVFSPWLFPFFIGPRWVLAGQIASALVPWLFMNFITSPVSYLFVVTRRQGTLFWFGIPFTAAPLLAIWFNRADILSCVTVLSWIMAGMLAIFLVLALWVAAGFDRGIGDDTRTPTADAAAEDEEIAETAELENELDHEIDGR